MPSTKSGHNLWNRINRRTTKGLLIYPSFQVKFIFWIFSASLVSSTIFLFFCMSWLEKMKSQGKSLQLPETHPYFILLKDFSETYIEFTIVGILASLVLSSIFGIYISHQIAGPLVRLKDHLADGNSPSQFSFRSGDLFKDLLETYARSNQGQLKK